VISFFLQKGTEKHDNNQLKNEGKLGGVKLRLFIAMYSLTEVMGNREKNRSGKKRIHKPFQY
jgi:hypothetical protein